MAGLQPARDDVRGEGIVEWMGRRRRDLAARGPEAELAGRAAWAGYGVTGELPYAPRPSDVVTLGARTIGRGPSLERSHPVVGRPIFNGTSDRLPTS